MAVALTYTAPAAYRTAAMMRASIARKTSIDSLFRGATEKSRLLGLVAAALTLALSAPTVAIGALYLAPPTVTGTMGDNSWFTSDVVVSWTFSGATTASTDCLPQQLTTDTPGTAITCTVSDNAGGSASQTVTVHIDRTPPTAVLATPARPPDISPFYTAPLPISWSATDATSGIAGCTALTYAGPDGPAVAPTGTCRDRAGNVSAALPFTFSYGMPPAPAPVIAAAPPPSTGGPTAMSTTAKTKAKRPTLTWRARAKVKYYNLQLFRNGHKILSAWPTVAHYTLKPSWRYRGHTYKLTAGRYRWYVWPGYGPRAAHRYGKLLTKGAVTVPRS
jgi:hypothetical protein